MSTLTFAQTSANVPSGAPPRHGDSLLLAAIDASFSCSRAREGRRHPHQSPQRGEGVEAPVLSADGLVSPPRDPSCAPDPTTPTPPPSPVHRPANAVPALTPDRHNNNSSTIHHPRHHDHQQQQQQQQQQQSLAPQQKGSEAIIATAGMASMGALFAGAAYMDASHAHLTATVASLQHRVGQHGRALAAIQNSPPRTSGATPLPSARPRSTPRSGIAGGGGSPSRRRPPAEEHGDVESPQRRLFSASGPTAPSYTSGAPPLQKKAAGCLVGEGARWLVRAGGRASSGAAAFATELLSGHDLVSTPTPAPSSSPTRRRGAGGGNSVQLYGSRGTIDHCSLPPRAPSPPLRPHMHASGARQPITQHARVANGSATKSRLLHPAAAASAQLLAATERRLLLGFLRRWRRFAAVKGALASVATDASFALARRCFGRWAARSTKGPHISLPPRLICTSDDNTSVGVHRTAAHKRAAFRTLRALAVRRGLSLVLSRWAEWARGGGYQKVGIEDTFVGIAGDRRIGDSPRRRSLGAAADDAPINATSPKRGALSPHTPSRRVSPAANRTRTNPLTHRSPRQDGDLSFRRVQSDYSATPAPCLPSTMQSRVGAPSAPIHVTSSPLRAKGASPRRRRMRISDAAEGLIAALSPDARKFAAPVTYSRVAPPSASAGASMSAVRIGLFGPEPPSGRQQEGSACSRLAPALPVGSAVTNAADAVGSWGHGTGAGLRTHRPSAQIYMDPPSLNVSSSRLAEDVGPSPPRAAVAYSYMGMGLGCPVSTASPSRSTSLVATNVGLGLRLGMGGGSGLGHETAASAWPWVVSPAPVPEPIPATTLPVGLTSIPTDVATLGSAGGGRSGPEGSLAAASDRSRTCGVGAAPSDGASRRAASLGASLGDGPRDLAPTSRSAGLPALGAPIAVMSVGGALVCSRPFAAQAEVTTPATAVRWVAEQPHTTVGAQHADGGGSTSEGGTEPPREASARRSPSTGQAAVMYSTGRWSPMRAKLSQTPRAAESPSGSTQSLANVTPRLQEVSEASALQGNVNGNADGVAFPQPSRPSEGGADTSERRVPTMLGPSVAGAHGGSFVSLGLHPPQRLRSASEESERASGHVNEGIGSPLARVANANAPLTVSGGDNATVGASPDGGNVHEEADGRRGSVDASAVGAPLSVVGVLGRSHAGRGLTPSPHPSVSGAAPLVRGAEGAAKGHSYAFDRVDSSRSLYSYARTVSIRGGADGEGHHAAGVPFGEGTGSEGVEAQRPSAALVGSAEVYTL